VVIGTRGSRLALAQTRWVSEGLREHWPDLDVVVRVISTEGDRSQAANVPLASYGEKGVFARDLEQALLKGEIDIAVHSMKDLAHTLPEGLTIGAIPPREDYRDCLIGATLEFLAEGARVGTGSVRRRALLLSRRPDLQFVEVRGNIDTRLRKLDEGQCDVLCLAVAGLNRLGLQSRITEILDPDWFTPDPGQGAIAVQICETDHRLRPIVAHLADGRASATVSAERLFLRAVGGSCKMPIGAIARTEPDSDQVTLSAMVASPDGTAIYRASVTGVFNEAWAPQFDHANAVLAKLRASGAGHLFEAEAQ
jgi:hydroxymethylbilane synthase